MHPLYGALIVPHASMQVTCNALVTHQYAYVTPSHRTSQYHSSTQCLSNDLANPVSDGVGLLDFMAGQMYIY